ncbi:uncharacterized protein HDAC6 isoform X2 [Panulirus ornatus]|uniref:uncharacterized protein HDAC6 isoform X2 n=1 Tax=Panulirus ornatus TaxID=150431 RepID=UPI003A8BA70B
MEDKKNNLPSQRKNSGKSQKAQTQGAGGAAGNNGENEGGEIGATSKSRKLASIRPRISIEELRNVFKRQASHIQEEVDPVFDPMAKAQESVKIIQGKTGVVYDERMAEHRCLWDENYPENPERLMVTLQRCKELGFLSRCETLVSRSATEEEILKHHSRAHLGLLWSTKGETDCEKLETLASHFDSIFLHPSTYENSLLAAGCTLDLVDAVASGKLQNGFAIVRPPGHHAMESEFCGYCYINNVALAAHHALEKHGLSRILIVDWDVHHGQASQYAFYSDPRVLYFSIHRFEHGSFWPHLKESDYNYIGEGAGLGFNFNIPLNKIGMKNEDYLAIFHQVLLPVAYEFNPELIIVSAGYDAAIGCFEGMMDLSPGFYAHLTSNLMTLAQGRVALVFEGGYYLDSLAEAAAMSLSALLGDPCPRLLDPIIEPSPSLRESLLNVIYVHRPYWKCFQYQGSFSVKEALNETAGMRHTPSLSFIGPTVRPVTYPTRDFHQKLSPEHLEKTKLKLIQLKQKERTESLPESKLCLVYDEEMSEHRNLCESEHPERPERVERIWEYLKKNKILERATVLQSRKATRAEVGLVHTKDHIDLMYSMEALSEEELQSLQENYKSIYLHPKSNVAALLAVGSLLQVVDNVCSNKTLSGIGVVRPPGHHAEQDHPHGFCFYNNVAIAAKYAIMRHGFQRILILDWDVHHGNGIQHAFESDPQVLYISIHRYDHGFFFPSSEDANFDYVGTGAGEGYNVNIPWNKSGMGDAEYMSAMLQVVLPIAYQYDPQLVLVSAGFDAARGDPLGGCYVTPECYGHMTHLLSGLAGGHLVLALEGGYNLNTISFCMTMCAKALLGDPLPMLDSSLVPNKSAVQSINDVIKTQSRYWSSICFQVHLPVEDVLCQGFGGGPQAVESGMSCTETSSCASSPISTPSTSTPPYVSAPSSPEKPKERKLFETASVTSVEHDECKIKTSMDEMEVDSSKHSSGSPCALEKRKLLHHKKENSMQKNLKESLLHSKTAETPPHGKESCLTSLGSASGQLKKLRRKCSKRGEGTRGDEDESLPNTRICHGRYDHCQGALLPATSIIDMIKVPTAIIYTENYCVACCMEHGQGLSMKTIIKRCEELQLLEMCHRLQPRPATKKEILSVHDEEIYQSLHKETKKCIHQTVISDNLLAAAGSTIELVNEITSGRAQNGIAILQVADQCMPSFDASPNVQLNNVAIGAQFAIDNLRLSRVLIIYWDGQSGADTQLVFRDDPRVLVFSVCLTKLNPQENVKGKIVDLAELGNTLNIELSCHALHCEDYYSIFHQLLLPIAYEFSPELVIVSASCGLSLQTKNIHPEIYSHLTGLLMPIAQGHLMFVLEAGEFKEVMAERVTAILSALQDKPSEFMQVPASNPSHEVQQAIIDVMSAQQANWKSLRLHPQASVISNKSKNNSAFHVKPYPEKDCSCELQRLADNIPSPKHTVCLVYDDTMMKHYNYVGDTHPEKPARINCIFQRLQEFGIVGRCHQIKARQASVSELECVHSLKHIKFMSSLLAKKPSELLRLQDNFESVYLHRHTNDAALTAAGSLVEVVDSVLSGKSQRGVAVVRPPGHHAERNEPHGFCFYNNVAIAAKHAINTHGLKRVLILDWDIHHGNGIQHMFEADPQVLYISIHRYDNGKFFPASSEGNYNRVGTKRGKGYNVNIPWNKAGMGDSDYMAAMVEVVMPIACQFNPQLVLVSAGFDAAVDDPLGGCNVTPECFGHMAKLLTCLAMGRVIVALEGGYNLNTISYCMTMCTKALLGDPLIPLAQKLMPCASAIDTLTKVVNTHRKFWSALNFKVEALSPLIHTPVSRREMEVTSFHQEHSTDIPASQANNKSFEETHPGIEELVANFDRVNLDEISTGTVSSSSEMSKREKLEKKMEHDNSVMGEACGGLAESSVNTFLLSEVAAAEMYAVVPVKWCPHLEQVKYVPGSGLRTASPCEECQDPSENWVCLTCYRVLCGRFVREHMLMHGLTEEHYMVLSFSDLSVWCYACDVYVHHPILFEAKRAAHLDKFGEDIPESS